MKYLYRSAFVLFLWGGLIALASFFLNNLCKHNYLVFLPIIQIFFPIYLIRLGIKSFKEGVKLGGGLFVVIGVLGIIYLLLMQFSFIIASEWCAG